MAELTTNTVVADEFRNNDRYLKDSFGNITGSLQHYVLQVSAKDILTVMRGVALAELEEQHSINNKVSQILVDGRAVQRRSINDAKRNIKLRFGNPRLVMEAVNHAYRLLQTVTRLQSPPQNSVVARRNFYLYLDGRNIGLMPSAVIKLASPDAIKQDSVVRIVGPLVPYGRRLFWNPVGASQKMQFKTFKSAKSLGGRRFAKIDGTPKTHPNFRPFSKSYLKKLTGRRGAANHPQLIAALNSGKAVGRIENAGQIVKRMLKMNSRFRSLHISDGWIEYAPAIGWSKKRDPRVPSISVQMAKRGAVNI